VKRFATTLWNLLRHPGGVVTAIGIGAIVVGTLAGSEYVSIVGPIIGAGTTLLAMGVSELLRFYRSTTELDYTLDLEIFYYQKTAFEGYNIYRVSALIYNPGNVIVKDAKATLTVEVEPEKLQEMLDLRCETSVNVNNPTIKGEPLPWASPEKYIRPPTAREIEYLHITSISPYQRTRLFLFDFWKYEEGYLIGFFSEIRGPMLSNYQPTNYRACLYIAKDREIRARVYVSGEGLRRPLEFCLKINKKVLDSIVENPKEVEKLSKC